MRTARYFWGEYTRNVLLRPLKLAPTESKRLGGKNYLKTKTLSHKRCTIQQYNRHPLHNL